MRPRQVITALGDLILPRHCTVCGTRLSADERFLCADCAEDFPLTYYWDMAYNPAADRLNENIQRGLTEYEPYARFAGLFFHNSDNGYRHICHRLKYSGDLAVGRHYSRELGRRLAGSPLFSDVDLVVPVPLHWMRRWKRGYNQADVIAREVAVELGARHCPNLLVRRRRTTTQTVLSIEEKKLNVRGAFAAGRIAERAKEWRPRHILIVDDVLTTGATIAECHTTLRKIFPSEVRISAATLACVESK